MNFEQAFRLFSLVAIVVIFVILILFMKSYADVLKKDPCSICASRMKGDILCTITSSGGSASRLFLINGTIIDSETRTGNPSEFQKVNYSELFEPIQK